MNMHASLASFASVKHASAWHVLLAERDLARDAYDTHHAACWMPLDAELQRRSPRPDLFFEIVARSGQVARSFVPANDLHKWDDHWSPLYREKAKAVREAWLAHQAVCEALGWTAACAESERLCEQQCDLEERLIMMPAPDQAALLWKLDHLFGAETRRGSNYGDAWCARWLDAVMRDAQRLLKSTSPLRASPLTLACHELAARN